MCAIAHELLLTVVGYVVYMWHGRMAAADRSLQAQLAITNWAQTSRRGLLPWTCVVQPQATAIASSFFSVSSLMCSMITRRFRKQGSCKYLDQQEGHTQQSQKRIRTFGWSVCFSGDATGTAAMDAVSVLDRSWSRRGGPADGGDMGACWKMDPSSMDEKLLVRP